MVNQAEEELQRITLNIYRRDYEWLRWAYPNNYSEVVRRLIRNHISRYNGPKGWQYDDPE